MMFARLSTYELPQDSVAEAVKLFRTAISKIEELPGLVDAYMLVSEDGTDAVTITLWHTPDALAASRVRASRVRSEAAETIGAHVRSTVEYGVAVHSIGRAIG